MHLTAARPNCVEAAEFQQIYSQQISHSMFSIGPRVSCGPHNTVITTYPQIALREFNLE